MQRLLDYRGAFGRDRTSGKILADGRGEGVDAELEDSVWCGGVTVSS